MVTPGQAGPPETKKISGKKDQRGARQTPIIPLLIMTVPSMIVGMWLFQRLKLFIRPDITLHQSHAITLIFNTILATVLVYFIVRKRDVMVNRLLDEISSRRQFQEALQESEERYRRIVETAYEGIWILDADMKITYLNQRMAEILGYPMEEMKGKSLFAFYDQELGDFLKQTQERHRQGLSEQIDLRARRRDGSELWTLVNATPIMDSDNKFIGLLGMSTDITKRKQAELALQRQGELLRELSARLAEVEENERKRLAAELHDLVGQNLTALGINLDIVQRNMTSGNPQSLLARLDDSMAIVDNTIECIRNVIMDLRPSILDDFGLTAAIRWYGELFSQRAGIAIEMDIEELPERLPAHTENAVFRIFQESLTNIQKHARASEVTVSLEAEGHLIRLLVNDNGIGFDPANAVNTPERKGWGLIMMAERAMETGSNFSLLSQHGKGAQVIVEVQR